MLFVLWKLPHLNYWYLPRPLCPGFNDLMEHGTCQSQWKAGIIKLIHKGGETSSTRNWRPICLTSAVGKAFHTILGHRLLNHALHAKVLDPEIQKGFLPGIKGTIEHTQSLCDLLEHQRRNKPQYYMVQFDLQNAFGAVPHNIILEALRWSKASRTLISYVQHMYKDASVRLKHGEGLTESVQYCRGVLQVDTLSPTLFLIVMEIVLRYMREAFRSCGIQHPGGKKIFQKAYADDLTIITRNPVEAQIATNALITVLQKLGMKLNAAKFSLFIMRSLAQR